MPHADVTTPTVVGDLADLAPSFLRHLRAKNRSPKPLKVYGDAAARLVASLTERPLLLPATGETMSAEHVDVSRLTHGTTIPGSKAFNAHSGLWATKTDVAIRLPWGLLGMADPSSRQALRVQTDGTISAVPIDQIGLTFSGGGRTTEAALRWEAWQTVRSTERPKDGVAVFSAAVGTVLSQG